MQKATPTPTTTATPTPTAAPTLTPTPISAATRGDHDQVVAQIYC